MDEPRPRRFGAHQQESDAVNSASAAVLNAFLHRSPAHVNYSWRNRSEARLSRKCIKCTTASEQAKLDAHERETLNKMKERQKPAESAASNMGLRSISTSARLLVDGQQRRGDSQRPNLSTAEAPAAKLGG